MSDTPTPLTDAYYRKHKMSLEGVDYYFARSLERHLRACIEAKGVFATAEALERADAFLKGEGK